MLQELSELLAKTNKADEIVIDSYTLKEGIYFKINLNGDIVDELIVNKDTNKNSELYQWFKVRDYYSKLVSMNKPVDKTKKIHSNNIFTIFIKTEILPGIGKDGKALSSSDLNNVVEGYFDKLESEPDKESKNILSSCHIEEIAPALTKKCRSILENGLKSAIDMIWEKEAVSGYLKLFVISDEDNSADIENYKRESERYVMPKIFNDNSYNVYIDDELMGLSNDNMQLNAKKPFLKLQGTKFGAPYRVSLNQALMDKKVFEWMESSVNENGRPNMRFSIPYDYNFKTNPNDENIERGFFIETIPDNGKRVVVDGDSIPEDISFLKRPFQYKNYFGLTGDNDRIITKRGELENLIDRYYFKNQIKIAYYDSSYRPKGCSSVVMNAVRVMSIPMKNYFRLGVESDLEPMIKKITMMIIKDDIRSNESSINSIKLKMNLRLSLLSYFKKKGETDVGDIVVDIAKKVKDRVLGEGEVYAADDREFYYCVGQLTRYIFDRSEAANKKMDMYTPILDAKNSERIKGILRDVAVKYAHNINISSVRYKRLLRMVMGYETDSKPDGDMILCGICDDNILYTKKKEEE